MRIGTVDLNIKDLKGILPFYTQVLGMNILEDSGNTITLGAATTPLVRLHHTPHFTRERTAGLYHFAVLLPSRADLGQILKHFVVNRTPLQGLSDHKVSEALYLQDPEGNGIEIYRDRPESEWLVQQKIHMTTEALDAQAVLSAAHPEPFSGLPTGTYMGHIHLHVSALDPAFLFYTQTLGMDFIQDYPQAKFLSYDGYHHHVGMNTWAGVGIANNNPQKHLGLRSFELYHGSEYQHVIDPSHIHIQLLPTANGSLG